MYKPPNPRCLKIKKFLTIEKALALRQILEKKKKKGILYVSNIIQKQRTKEFRGSNRLLKSPGYLSCFVEIN